MSGSCRTAHLHQDLGQSADSGWREYAGTHDGLDLPDDDFDYEEFTRREFGHPAKPAGLRTVWWVVAIALLVISIIALLGGRN